MIVKNPNKIDKVAVGCILVYNDKFLLVHRTKDRFWGSVAGDIEGNETVKECAKREVFEELGFNLELSFFDKTYHDYSGEIVEYDIFYHIFKEDPSEKIKLAEADEFGFFSFEEALKLNLFEDEDYCLELFKNEKL